MRSAALVLAVLVIATAVPAEAKPVHAQAGPIHVHATLKAPPALKRAITKVAGAAPPAPTPGPLQTIVAFGQSVVAGEDDLAAIARVAPPQGERWTGLWWATSETGSTTPATADLDDQGLFVDLTTGATAKQAGPLHVAFHFLDAAGHETIVDAPAASVLASRPARDEVLVSAAAIASGARADLPRVLVVSTWNLHDHEAIAAIDVPGGPYDHVQLGSCATHEIGAMEPGCRAVFLIEVGSASGFELTEQVGDMWESREAHAFADLPYLLTER